MSYKVAIITPGFNEEARILLWIESVIEATKNFSSNIAFEIVIIDDGSTDKTSELVKTYVSKSDSRGLNIPITLLKMQQNSGHNVALTTGMDAIRDSVDAIVTLDADGEHPALLIAQLIHAWNFQPVVVHTVRRPNSKLPPSKILFSKVFYFLMNLTSGLPISSGMADFKLWDTRLLKNYKTPLFRYGPTRLLAVAVSPDGPKIPFDQIVIEDRISRFSNAKMWHLAISSFVFFNRINFKLLTVIGSFAFCGAWIMPAENSFRDLGLTASGALTLLGFALFGFTQSFKNKTRLVNYACDVLILRSQIQK